MHLSLLQTFVTLEGIFITTGPLMNSTNWAFLRFKTTKPHTV